MRTIPDTIELIKKKLIRLLDCYYSIIERSYEIISKKLQKTDDGPGCFGGVQGFVFE